MPNNSTFFKGEGAPVYPGGSKDAALPEAIPIILVPGISGSNLRVKAAARTQVRRRFEEDNRAKEYTDQAWAPPNEPPTKGKKVTAGLIETTYFFDCKEVKYSKQWERFGPKFRQIMLNPETTEVDDEGYLPKDLVDIDGRDGKTVAKERGWGSVHWDSYGPFLCYLQHHLNLLPFDTPSSNRAIFQKGSFEKFPPLASAHQLFPDAKPGEWDFDHAAKFCYPVFAAGYNWTRSCLDSARALLDKIDDWIERIQRVDHLKCSKVILVTHSMGGLVARAAAQLEKEMGAARILGVIHGVMPAIGAPETYRMVVAGEVREGTPFFWRDVKMIQSRLLGPTRADATAVIANAEGPLELLPSHLYSPKWLQTEREWDRAEVREERALPQGNNPYDEIYREKEAPWRMVDPALLDPAGKIANKRKFVQNPIVQSESPWNRYINRINRIEKFHKKYLNHDGYHLQTFVFYGSSIRSYKIVRWRYFSKNLIHDSFSWDRNKVKNNGQQFKSNNNTKDANQSENLIVMISNRQQYQKDTGIPHIMTANGMGDGTVPEESGKAPEECEFVRKNVYHIPSLKHQSAYNSEPSRVFTMLAICKIVREWNV